MKDGKKFTLWIVLGLAAVIIVPLVLTFLFIWSSNYVSPVIFIALIVLAAALISYFGKVGR